MTLSKWTAFIMLSWSRSIWYQVPFAKLLEIPVDIMVIGNRTYPIFLGEFYFFKIVKIIIIFFSIVNTFFVLHFHVTFTSWSWECLFVFVSSFVATTKRGQANLTEVHLHQYSLQFDNIQRTISLPRINSRSLTGLWHSLYDCNDIFQSEIWFSWYYQYRKLHDLFRPHSNLILSLWKLLVPVVMKW